MKYKSDLSKLFLTVLLVFFLPKVQLLLPSPATPVTRSDLDQSSQAKALKTYGQLPLRFEANQGQSDEHVEFISRGGGYALFLTLSEAMLVLRKPAAQSEDLYNVTKAAPTAAEAQDAQAPGGVVLHMQLVDASPTSQIVGLDPLPGKSNYFIGDDPQKWYTNVPSYAKVRYQNVYPGVDLVYYGNPRQLEYDFVVAPGADPMLIKLSFAGAERLDLDDQGDLLVRTGNRQVRMDRPRIYQEANGVRQTVPGGYVLEDDQAVSFHIVAYDASIPLVIDPVLDFSTFLGASDFDSVSGIAVDESGAVYVVGTTHSLDFPTTPGAFQSEYADAFVAKLRPDGSGLEYSTYLGGGDAEVGNKIAVDASGAAYITGYANSVDFPITPDAYQTSWSGGMCGSQRCFDVFVAKLGAGGDELVYSTFLGGEGHDYGHGIALDVGGAAYVTGHTKSADFPTTPGAFQATCGGGWPGCRDAFVTKVSTDGSGLVYSTFLGGSDHESAFDIAVDDSGAAYVTGVATEDFPTTPGAFQTECNYNPVNPSSCQDAFVTKLNPEGSELVYSTFLGGSPLTVDSYGTCCGDDYGLAVAVDANGAAYVTGFTVTEDFPTSEGAFQTAYGGLVGENEWCLGDRGDAFATKLNADGSALVYSTYLGGNDVDTGSDIAVDANGAALVVGSVWSCEPPVILYPTTPGAFQTGCHEAPYCGEHFLTKLSVDGSALVYSTFLGGSEWEWYGFDVINVVVDTDGIAYLGGMTVSSDFPTTPGAFQTTCSSCPVFDDGFVTKMRPEVVTPTGIEVSVQPREATTAMAPVAVTFGEITEAGTAGLTMSSSGPEPPAGFSLDDPPTYYDLSTTALYSPPVEVCITYDPAQYTDPENLYLLHYEDGAWVDVTTSNDTVNHVIRGEVSYLSPFAVAEPSNRPPEVVAGGPYSIGEGDSVAVAAWGSDPDGDPLTYAWDLDNDGTLETLGQSVTFSAAGLDGPSSHTIAVQVTDSGGLSATDQTTVEVLNVAPSVGEISAPLEPVQVNTEISVGAIFTDPGALDTHEAVWDWGDGAQCDTSLDTDCEVVEEYGSGSVRGSQTYTETGVYVVGLTVTDDDGGWAESIYKYVVMYDPYGGFVTGGGWIDSPEGAYTPDPALTGKAYFGFVSKYKKGASEPIGQTEFQFKVADLNFHSDSYDWLVVSGPRAKYKGTGTINGGGNYGFMLTVTDAELTPSTDVDLFRIKIWDKDNNDAIVYDNQMGEDDDSYAGTEIGGGNIKIHKAK